MLSISTIWVLQLKNVAEQWHLTREELDEFSANSQQKATAAIEAGKFKDEIVPVEVKLKKKTVVVDTDEGPRPGTTAEVFLNYVLLSRKMVS